MPDPCGLMINGLWLQWQIGANVSAGNPFVLVTALPAFRALRQDPWRTAYLIVLAKAIVLALAGLLFGISHRLTTYGKAYFQAKGEFKKNGFLGAWGPSWCPASSGNLQGRAGSFPAARGVIDPASAGSFSMAWQSRPITSGARAQPDVALRAEPLRGPLIRRKVRYRHRVPSV